LRVLNISHPSGHGGSHYSLIDAAFFSSASELNTPYSRDVATGDDGRLSKRDLVKMSFGLRFGYIFQRRSVYVNRKGYRL
jgi:hypothetical protein